LYQVFISHASDRNGGFVDFLVQEFEERYPELKLFLHEHSRPNGEGAPAAVPPALEDASVGES
jgi:hypothetical protein